MFELAINKQNLMVVLCFCVSMFVRYSQIYYYDPASVARNSTISERRVHIGEGAVDNRTNLTIFGLT